MNKQQGVQHQIQRPTGSHCMRQQHRWIRQQLICCFIHTYTQAHRLPPTVREIGDWVGCPGMRSLQLALADLERQQYLTRQSHAQRSMVLTAKGIALAERWQLLVPVAGAVVEAPPAKPLYGNPPIPRFKIPPAQWPTVLQHVAEARVAAPDRSKLSRVL